MAPNITLGENSLPCYSISPVTAGNIWPVPTTAAEVWNVPGIDGKGVGLGSLNDPECEVVCIQYGTREAVTEWQGEFDKLLGKTVSMETYLGQIRSWIVVLEILEHRIDPALLPNTNIQKKGTVRLRVVVKYKYTRRPGNLSSFTGVSS